MIDWKFWGALIALACVIYVIEWFVVIPTLNPEGKDILIPFFMSTIVAFVVSVVLAYPEKVRELFNREQSQEEEDAIV